MVAGEGGVMGDEMMKDKESLPIASNPSNADYPALLNLARMYRGAYGLMKTLGLTSTKLDDLAAARRPRARI